MLKRPYASSFGFSILATALAVNAPAWASEPGRETAPPVRTVPAEPPPPAAMPPAQPMPTMPVPAPMPPMQQGLGDMPTPCRVPAGSSAAGGLSAAAAASVMDCVMAHTDYGASGHIFARDYRGWARRDGAPIQSPPHNDRYVAVYANERALTQSPFLSQGKPQLGAVIATPSFSVAEDGAVSAGPLVLLEKMQRGFLTYSGNWRYTVIAPDGQIVAVSKSLHHDDLPFCKTCDDAAGTAIFNALLSGEKPPAPTGMGPAMPAGPSGDVLDPSQLLGPAPSPAPRGGVQPAPAEPALLDPAQMMQSAPAPSPAQPRPAPRPAPTPPVLDPALMMQQEPVRRDDELPAVLDPTLSAPRQQ